MHRLLTQNYLTLVDDLVVLSSWCDTWQLSLNQKVFSDANIQEKKCNTTRLSLRRRAFEGITLSMMSWKSHCRSCR